MDISRTPPFIEAPDRDSRTLTGTLTLGELKAKLHQAVLAEVTATFDVSPDERQLLVADKLAAELPQTVRAAWLSLLNSANLQLVTLKVEGRVLHALTDQLLLAAQKVMISLDSHGQLRLRLAPPAPGTASSATAPTPLEATASPQNVSRRTESAQPSTAQGLAGTGAPQKFAAAQVSMATASRHPDPEPVARFHRNLEMQLRTELTEVVRRTLPLAEPPSRLLASAAALVQQIDPKMLTDDAGPAATLAHLSRLIAATPRWDQWQLAPHKTLESALTTFSLGAPTRQDEGAEEQLNYPALVQALRTLLSRPPPTSLQPTDQEPAGWEKALWPLLKHHHEPLRAESERNNLPPLLRLLKESLDGAAARLELQQSRSLLSQTNPGTTTHPVQIADIPLRFGDHWFGNIHLQIHEQRERAGSKSGRGKPKRSKWIAYLELGLNDEQGLAVELAMIGSQVEATLWCSQKQMHQQTQNKLGELRATLEADGLEVVDLRCLATSPPRRDNGIGVSLIDVKT